MSDIVSITLQTNETPVEVPFVTQVISRPLQTVETPVELSLAIETPVTVSACGQLATVYVSVLGGAIGPRGETGQSGDFFGVALYGFSIDRDAEGRIETLTYTNGTILSFARNGDGALSSVTSNTGKSKTFNRDIDGTLISVTGV